MRTAVTSHGVFELAILEMCLSVATVHVAWRSRRPATCMGFPEIRRISALGLRVSRSNVCSLFSLCVGRLL